MLASHYAPRCHVLLVASAQDAQRPYLARSAVLKGGQDGQALTADVTGRFALDEIPRGRAHFVVRREGYRPVITPSMEI